MPLWCVACCFVRVDWVLRRLGHAYLIACMCAACVCLLLLQTQTLMVLALLAVKSCRAGRKPLVATAGQQTV